MPCCLKCLRKQCFDSVKASCKQTIWAVLWRQQYITTSPKYPHMLTLTIPKSSVRQDHWRDWSGCSVTAPAIKKIPTTQKSKQEQTVVWYAIYTLVYAHHLFPLCSSFLKPFYFSPAHGTDAECYNTCRTMKGKCNVKWSSHQSALYANSQYGHYWQPSLSLWMY